MFEKIKRFIFKKEYEHLEMERTLLKAFNANNEKKLKSITHVDLMRAILQGFDIKKLSNALYDSVETAPDILDSMDESQQNAFLAQVVELNKNSALQKIRDHLAITQILHASKEALDITSVNFSRATINGLSLEKDEIERLVKVYDERHQREEGYNKHDVV